MNKSFIHITAFLLIVLLAVSCNGLQTTVSSQDVGTVGATTTKVSQTPTSTVTSTPQLTLTPTQTIQPSVTPTVQSHESALTTQNINKIVELKEFGRSYPRRVVWLPGGEALAVADSSQVSILSAVSLDTVQTIDPQTAYPDISINPNGDRLFVTNGTVQVWDLATGLLTDRLGYIEGGIRSFAVSANGRILAIAGPAWPGGGDPDYELEIVEIATGRTIYSVQQYGIIGFVAVDPEGKLVASNSERGLEMFDGQTGALLWTMKSSINAMAFGPQGVLVLNDTRVVREPIQLWDAMSGPLLRTIPDGYGNPIFSNDLQWLALWANRGNVQKKAEIQIWDATSYKLVRTLNRDAMEISDVAFSPDGQNLAVVTQDGLVLWDIANDQITNSLSGFTPPIYSVTFSYDSSWIFGGTDGSLAQVWDVESGVLLSPTTDYDHVPVTNVQSPDGKIKVEEWIDDSVYPPTGSIRLIDISNGEVIHELVGHKVLFGEGFTGIVESLSFNWDGSILASAGYDNDIRLWDVSTGSLLLTLPSQTLLTDVTFSPDGRYLAISSADGTIRLWGLTTP